MTHPLPGAWNLIVDSWNAFTKHWSLTVKYSIWIVLAVAVQQIVFFFPEETASWWTAFVVGMIASIAIALWVSIRLYQVILALEAEKPVDAKTTATATVLIAPFLLIGVLQGIATLGALVLLILPGIYVAIRLNFAPFALLEQGTRGRAALIASWELTKNKFWAIFGRQLAGGVVFSVGMILLFVALMLLFMLIIGNIGNDGLEALDDSSGVAPFLFGIGNGLIQAAVLPLFAVFQVKLYNAIKAAS